MQEDCCIITSTAMDFLLDPNSAYLILLAGLALLFLAIVTPGTGLLELSAFFALVLAAFEAYNLSVRWWALTLLLLSLVPFGLAMRFPQRPLYLVLSIALLIGGSAYLYGGAGFTPSVNPLLATIASASAAITLWIVFRKAITALAAAPQHDVNALVGETGEARTAIHEQGTASVDSELWSARSESKVPAGSRIRVIGRDGFVLIVEKIDPLKR